MKFSRASLIFVGLIFCVPLFLANCQGVSNIMPKLTPQLTPESTAVPYQDLNIDPNTIDHLTTVDRFGKGINYGSAISPDGQMLAIATASGIYLYDLQTVVQKQFINYPIIAKVEVSGIKNLISFSPDGNFLAFGISDIVIWNLRKNRVEKIISNPINEFSFTELKFSPKGDTLAVIDKGAFGPCDGWGSAFLLIDFNKQIPLYSQYYCPQSHEYSIHFAKNNQVGFFKDGTATDDHFVNASTGIVLKTIKHSDSVMSVSNDGTKLTVPFWKNILTKTDYSSEAWTKIIDIENGETVDRRKGFFFYLDDFQDRRLLILPDKWSILDSNLREICSSSEPLDILLNHYDVSGNTLVKFNSQTQNYEIWDLTSCHLSNSIFFPAFSGSLSLLTNGNILLSQDNLNIYLWDLKKNELVKIINKKNVFSPPIDTSTSGGGIVENSIHAVGSNNTILAFSSYPTFTFCLLGLNENHCQNSVNTNFSFASSVLISPNEKAALFNTPDGIYLWDIEKKVFRFYSPDKTYYVNFISDGSQFYIEYDNKILIYDTETAAQQTSIEMFSDPKHRTFTNNGKYFLEKEPEYMLLSDLKNNNLVFFDENYPPLANPNSSTTPLEKLNYAYTDNYTKFIFNNDDSILLGLMNEEPKAELRLWDTKNGKLLREIPFSQFVDDAIFSPDNQTIYTTSRGMIYVWKIDYSY